MALTDLVDVRVEFGLGTLGESGDVWDTALWDEGRWSGSDIQWTDMTALCHSVVTKTGKNTATQPLLKRFRTGTATFVMDNTMGEFVPSSETTPGFLQLRPGRYVRVMARTKQGADPGTTIPIPNNTQWQDSTGRTWTAVGAGLIYNDPGTPVAEFIPIWYGRIDEISNTHKKGDLRATVRCVDAFSNFAVQDTDEQPAIGAGETAYQRFIRIFNYYGWPLDKVDIIQDPEREPGLEYTLQAINFAQPMLENLQDTAEAAGGAVWQGADGTIFCRGYGWESETVDWYLGGGSGLPLRSVTPSWSAQDIINVCRFAKAGSTGEVQTAQDTASQVVYGLRSYQRFDFVNDSNPNLLTLATGVVGTYKKDKQYINEVTMLVQDFDTVDFILNLQIGDLCQITTDTIWNWSTTSLANILSITDEITAEGWLLRLGLQDADIPNEYGPYAREEFSNAFHLGGPEDA